MPSSRDDDLDWLYGRERPRSAEPEPTQVMPSDPRAQAPDAPRSSAPRPERMRSTAVQPAVPPPPTGPSAPNRVPPPPAYGSAVPDPQQATPGTPGPGGSWSGGPGGPGGQPPGMPPTRVPPTGVPPTKPPKRRRPVRTALRIVAVVVLLAVVGLIGIPVYAWNQVERVDDAPAGERPADQPGQTFLLVGSDSREGLTKEEQKRLGTGSTAGQRTDTMMILHVPKSGRPALVSIPRDSYVGIPGNGKNKINAAYSFGGAKLLVQTVEQNTGLRIDGYLEIGFGGFVNVIDALDGIEMCLPKKIKDKNSHINLPKGCQTLGGTDALGYVRMRYADPRGDLGRVERQRAMLAAVAKKGASPATVLNPARYWKLCNAGAASVRLGQETSFFQMVSLGLAMKKVAGGDGLTLTVPVSDPGASTPVGSAVIWDKDKAKAMFADIARGDTSDLAQYAK